MTDIEKKRLEWWLTDGMARSPEYNIQNQFIYMQAYADTTPRIAQYIDDQKKRGTKNHYWGEELYKVLNTQEVTNILTNQLMDGNFTALKRYTLLLQVLGCTDLASKFTESISCQLMLEKCNDVGAKAILIPFPDLIAEFINKFNTDPGSAAPKEQLDRYLQAQNLKKLVDELGGINKLGNAVMDLFLILRVPNDTILETMSKVMAKFADKYQNCAKFLQYASKALLSCAWGAAAYSLVEIHFIDECLVQGFLNFNQLNDFQKAQFCLRAMVFVAEFALMVPEFGKMIAGISTKAYWEQAMEAIAGCAEAIGEFLKGSFLADFAKFVWATIGDGLTRWCQYVAKFLAEHVFSYIDKALKFVGTALELAFGWMTEALKSFLKVLGPALGVIAAFDACITFFEDLMAGDTPTYKLALEGILAVITILEVLVMFMELAFTSVVLMPLGVALGVIGVIVALVLLFFPPPPPPTPVDVWMNGTFYPWMDKILFAEIPKISPTPPK